MTPDTGTTLAQIVEREGGLPLDIALVVGWRVAVLVAQVHQHGRSAGTLRPDEIRVRADGRVTLTGTSDTPPTLAAELSRIGELVSCVCAQPLPYGLRRLASHTGARWYSGARHVAGAIRRRLATADITGLERMLGSCATGISLPAPRVRKRPVFSTVATVVSLVVLLISAGAGVVYYSGAHNALLMPTTVGSLRLDVTVSGRIDSDGVTAAVQMLGSTEEDGRPAVSLPLRPEREHDTRLTRSFTTGVRYLPAGLYRLRLRTAGASAHQTFLLGPIADRDGPTVISIELDYLPAPTTAVRISASDALDDSPLEPAIYVARNLPTGEWSTYERVPNAAIDVDADQDIRFLIQADGYYTQRVTLPEPPRPASFVIRASMVPEPATVVITSEVAGVRLMLDGEPYYLQGGPAPTPARLPTLGVGETSLTLAPGTYELTAGVTGAGSTTAPLRLAGGATVQARVVQDGSDIGLIIGGGR